jgi:uncharacterized protein YhaN
LDPNVGVEAVELIRHFVGCQLRLKEIQEAEKTRLIENGYYKKNAVLAKAKREAYSLEDGDRFLALTKEQEALKAWRRELTAPWAPARQAIREKLALVVKVGFPEVLRQAGAEPILPEI